MKKYLCILVLIVFSSLCNAQLVKEVNNKPSTKKVLSLNTMQETDWSLYYGVQDQNAPQTPNELLKSKFKNISATVPGNVEIDLEREGIIEDPMIGTNVYDLRKYETYAWWYTRKFDEPKFENGERVELVFDGID